MTTPRGRRSSASLEVVRPDGVTAIERATVPSDLTDRQAEEWRRITNRMPADWFPPETHALLKQYVRHVVQADWIAHMLAREQSGREFDMDEIRRLTQDQERESRNIASLATKMRISQQTMYDKSKKRGSQVKRPWD